MPAGGVDAEVAFTATPNGVPSPAVTVRNPVPGDAARLAPQLRQVGRPVDEMEVGDGETGTDVRMVRRLPATAPSLTPERMDETRANLAEHVPGTPLDELKVQNQQLIAALDEVRAQRDELARRNAEAKSRFLANVSHELRAPVTAIIGLGRLLTDSSSDRLTGEQERQVELIRGSATDLLTLVNGLLDLAKAEAGRIEPNWSEVDLRAMFSQLRGTLRPLAPRPDVDFIIDEPAVPAVRSDEVLLAQVLRNLLINALKFTATGSVRLSARRAGDDVEFAVADTGTGIPEELHERIFEEFYQVPGSQALAGKGTGLGLPYARRLAEILGGTLHVASVPGEGSTFTVRLSAEPL